MQNGFIDKRFHDLSRTAVAIQTTAVFLALLTVALVLPLLVRYVGVDFLARNDQWIMGTVVNCALVIVGVNFARWKTIMAVVFLPSTVHVINFYFFSIGTVFSLYMIPAIWIGNLALVLIFKYMLVHKKQNYVITAGIAVIVKAAIIFAIFNVLVAIGTIPPFPAQMMTPRMGVNQLVVGAVGCAIAYVILKVFYKAKYSNK